MGVVFQREKYLTLQNLKEERKEIFEGKYTQKGRPETTTPEGVGG